MLTDITFNVTLRRKTLFYTINLIFPCVGMSFLSILVFYLPSDSNEKVSSFASLLISFLHSSSLLSWLTFTARMWICCWSLDGQIQTLEHFQVVALHGNVVIFVYYSHQAALLLLLLLSLSFSLQPKLTSAIEFAVYQTQLATNYTVSIVSDNNHWSLQQTSSSSAFQRFHNKALCWGIWIKLAFWPPVELCKPDKTMLAQTILILQLQQQQLQHP